MRFSISDLRYEDAARRALDVSLGAGAAEVTAGAAVMDLGLVPMGYRPRHELMSRTGRLP